MRILVHTKNPNSTFGLGKLILPANLSLKNLKAIHEISSQMAGIAGEYFVAAELSRRNCVATVTLRNTRGIDIMAANEKATHQVTIQCKTNRHGKRHWILNKKCEKFVGKDHFYIFVILAGIDERPVYYVVPSQEVARHTKTSHRNYLRTPGRNGRKHKDGSMRKFSVSDDKFLEKWDLLGL